MRTMRNWRDSLVVGLAAVLVAAFYAGLAPATAQEQEDERRARVQVSFPGSGGYLGVQVTDVGEERASELGMSRPHGVYIVEVVDGDPAAEAGIEEGDVVVAWNGERLQSVAQLRRLAGETPAGRVVDLTVLRAGAEREMSVELAERAGFARGRALNFFSPQIDVSGVYAAPSGEARERVRELVEDQLRDARARSAEVFYLAGRPRLGVSTQSLGDQLAEYFGVEGGALVTSVFEDTPAAEGGLRAGDVIVGLGGDDIDDPGDLRRALADIEEPGEVSVRIVHDGMTRTITVQLREPEAPFRWGRMGDELDDGADSVEAYDWDFDFDLPRIDLPRIDLPRISLRV